MKRVLLLTIGLSLLILGLAVSAQEKVGNENPSQKVSEGKDSKKDSAEVIVKFKPDTKEEQIKSLADEIGMLEVKKITELRLRVFKVTPAKKIEDVVRQCEKKPFVEYAEANKKVTTKK
jgi:hypothetical protein